ncbi:muskelin-like isoform X2 [Corticium candelabrum]|uniref:muskelin-like isoform X2 n=1 Tax=Corticium candelabrum TaxID=121492 RepID=UPI002E25E0D6|nr:muskelin-like isoform X2 [Corticium candelabrum]
MSYPQTRSSLCVRRRGFRVLPTVSTQTGCNGQWRDSSLSKQKLTYSVKSYSSFSQTYKPSNVLDNKPSDQGSRWSSESNHPPQFLTLKLDKTSIVSSITFGKHEKAHVCNLKKFQVFGGLDEEHMSELYCGGLLNNHSPETFQLRHTTHGHQFPCNYIKIVPLLAWGPSFNFSIWYIELHGHDEEAIVQPVLKWFSDFRQRQAMRLCLKHLRQHGYMDEFERLQKKSCIQLEEQPITELYQVLVVSDDFVAAERILEQGAKDGLFSNHVAEQSITAEWKALKTNCSGKYAWPGIRGGHQMVIDSDTQMVYLFGGWDGTKDLADLWCYNILAAQWTCLSVNSELQGGPSARSCHKMCIDCVNKRIYTLGRFIDSQARQAAGNNLRNDFYCYDITANTWNQLSEDTTMDGGPRLLFDHQMCMDTRTETLYVFGGRILLLPDKDNSNYARNVHDVCSGLFSYHCSSNTWKQLHSRIPLLRLGHVMLFHEQTRNLYILGGQGRDNTEPITDIIVYNVDTERVDVVLEDEQVNVPQGGYMQRATIDCELNEIYVFKGQNRYVEEGHLNNSFWVYDTETRKWAPLYKSSGDQRLSADPVEPCPRYAHQLVYDHIRKVHYLFAGNRGRAGGHKMRLDDFWMLQLKRLSVNDIVQGCKYMIRKQSFRPWFPFYSSNRHSWLMGKHHL